MSILTRGIPHKLLYGRHINAAACMVTRIGYTTASSPQIVWIRDRCKGWHHKPCAKWNREQVLDRYRLVRWSAILWRPDLDKHLISRLGSSLDRRELHRLAIRDNGASFIFITGEVDNTDIERLAAHYGYSVVALNPDEDRATQYLRDALSLEEKPLNNERKVQPDHGFKALLRQLEKEDRDPEFRDRDPEFEDRDPEFSRVPEVQTDSTPSMSLESDCEKRPVAPAEPSEFQEPIIQVRVLEQVYQDWSKRVRADDRYEVWDSWDTDRSIYRWRGGGLRPSWGIPNTSIKGL